MELQFTRDIVSSSTAQQLISSETSCSYATFLKKYRLPILSAASYSNFV